MFILWYTIHVPLCRVMDENCGTLPVRVKALLKEELKGREKCKLNKIELNKRLKKYFNLNVL